MAEVLAGAVPATAARSVEVPIVREIRTVLLTGPVDVAKSKRRILAVFVFEFDS